MTGENDADRPLQRLGRPQVGQELRRIAGKLTGLAALLETDQTKDVRAGQAGDEIGRRIIEDIVDGKG